MGRLQLCILAILMVVGRASASAPPRIVNIVNFIRLLEPRDSSVTEEVLYKTVEQQIELMKKNRLGGTFLLQYDALLDPRYQNLLKSLPDSLFEVGTWWEIPQPLVENAGLHWRGRYPWDWDADVDFSSGYSPAEREQLVDTYMRDFKRIFGHYPKSVGSWFIDAYTLNYMYQKYGIVASCNCKDQIGTDGYTLWGGYWNQAYYPSLTDAYMPAQDVQHQIPVPIFRMLGSDPIRQYDSGLGSNGQGVVTLEPVYPFGGGDATWVDWYFKQFVQGACMGFNYVQAGQENSFTWGNMAKGLEIQFPLIAKLRDQGLVKVETLAASGQWFKNHFKVTPPTAVSFLEDLSGHNKKTVWFDSRFFRLNLLWDSGSLRIRDIHVFDQNLSDNVKKENGAYPLVTLPFVDGFVWSDHHVVAGLRLKVLSGGQEVDLRGGQPYVSDSVPGHLLISWPLEGYNGVLHFDITEREIHLFMSGDAPSSWSLNLSTASGATLPFLSVKPHQLACRFKGADYSVEAPTGYFKQGEGAVFRIYPQGQKIVLRFNRG
jgi:hypothetical protein